MQRCVKRTQHLVLVTNFRELKTKSQMQKGRREVKGYQVFMNFKLFLFLIIAVFIKREISF